MVGRFLSVALVKPVSQRCVSAPSLKPELLVFKSNVPMLELRTLHI